MESVELEKIVLETAAKVDEMHRIMTGIAEAAGQIPKLGGMQGMMIKNLLGPEALETIGKI